MMANWFTQLRRGLAWDLIGVLLLAAGLRTVGLGFGLPHVYNPDEIAIMARTLGFAKGDLNPHNFLYPTFYFYLLFGWLGGYYALGRFMGFIPSLEAFQTQFFVDPSAVYLAGRLFGALCGVASVLAVYAIGRRLAGRAAGTAAALFLACAPFAVRDAHYVKHDVPATLFVLVAYRVFLGLDESGTGRSRSRWLVIAGAACGVAFSTHYYTVFLLVPLLMLVAWPRPPVAALTRDVSLAVASSAVVFLALSPFLAFEIRTALNDIVANRAIVVDRAVSGSQGLFAHAGTYAQMLARDAVGWPVLLLGAAGAVILTRDSRRKAALLLAFPLTFLVFISNTFPATRYLNPVLPFVALFAGFAVTRPARWNAGGDPKRIALVCVLAAAPGCWDSFHADRFFRQTDTRTLALRYVEAHVPAGSGVAIQPYSVPLTQSKEGLVEALEAHLGDVRRASVKFSIRLRLDPYPSPAYRTIYIGDGGQDADKIYVGYAELGGGRALARFRELGVTWVLVKRYNKPAPESVPLLEALETGAQLQATFSPYRPGIVPGAPGTPEPFLHNTDARVSPALERPGPVIEVWRLPPVEPRPGPAEQEQRQ